MDYIVIFADMLFWDYGNLAITEDDNNELIAIDGHNLVCGERNFAISGKTWDWYSVIPELCFKNDGMIGSELSSDIEQQVRGFL